MLRWQYLLLSALTLAIAANALVVLIRYVSFEKGSAVPSAYTASNAIADSQISSPAPIPTEKSSQSATRQGTESLIEQLKLTVRQQQQIERIRLQYQQQIGTRQENLQLLEQQLAQMMAGTEPAAAVRLKNQELMALRHKIAKLRFESMLATREILTQSQRQKFMEIVEARRDRLQ